MKYKLYIIVGGGTAPTKQERGKWHRLNVISSKTSERRSEV